MNIQHMRAVHGPANIIQFRGRQVEALFSSRDLFDLRRWGAGDTRIEIDRLDEPDSFGQFAMIYEGDRSWASWAITREKGKVLLWDCVSHADLGRFDTMRQALAALPGDCDDTLPSLPAQVIYLWDAAGRPASV